MKRTYAVFYGPTESGSYVETEASYPQAAAVDVVRKRHLAAGTRLRVSAVQVGRGTGKVTHWVAVVGGFVKRAEAPAKEGAT